MKIFEYINHCQAAYERVNESNYERALELIMLEHRILGVLYFHRELRDEIYKDVKESVESNLAKPVHLYFKRADDLFNRYWDSWKRDIKLQLFLSHLKLVAFEEYCKKNRVKTPKFNFSKVVSLKKLKDCELEEVVERIDERHFGLDKEDLSDYVVDYELEREEKEALLGLKEMLRSEIADKRTVEENVSEAEIQSELREMNELNFDGLVEFISSSIEPGKYRLSGFFIVKRYHPSINYIYNILDDDETEVQIEEVREKIESISIPGVRVACDEIKVSSGLIIFGCKIYHDHLSGYEIPINIDLLDRIVDIK